jgi:hypothetical protein
MPKVEEACGGELYIAQIDRFDNYKSPATFGAEHFSHEARMATALIEKWGMVAATPDGESSDGRQQLRMLSPNEVVRRACDTATIAIEAFRSLGWIHKLPKHLVEGSDE